MDWTNLIIGLLSATNITTLLGFFYTLRASKRKSNAESKISEFDATEKIIAIYKKMADDLISNYEKRILILESDIKELKKLKCEKETCENREP